MTTDDAMFRSADGPAQFALILLPRTFELTSLRGWRLFQAYCTISVLNNLFAQMSLFNDSVYHISDDLSLKVQMGPAILSNNRLSKEQLRLKCAK